ncbi:MAG: cohesin domain-containing protein [Candidatus Poribacteria bacterium]|nr:cohesin domain-containing protein [Candidatus Poribacteria bacterium]
MKSVLTILSLWLVIYLVATPPILAANRVLSLDGDNDYVKVFDSDTLFTENEFTVEAWFKIAYITPGRWNQIVSNDEYEVAVDGETHTIVIWENGTGGDRWGKTEILTDTWYHVAFIDDGTTHAIWLNGRLDARSGDSRPSYRTAQDLWIGCDPTPPTRTFEGQIDEVRIWRIARTPEDIQATMNTSLTGDEIGLVGYWNFDDGTARDRSPYNNDGTLEGNARVVEVAPSDDFLLSLQVTVFLEDNVVNPGDPFTTDIPVYFAKGVLSFRFDLRFNPDTLQAVSVEEGSLFSRYGVDETTWQTPKVDNERGVIANIRCRRTDDSGVSENEGILAVVTFKAQQLGSSEIRVENLTLVSENGAQRAARTQAGSVEVFPNGSISGVVQDAVDKTPVKGVKIEVSNQWFRLQSDTYSDEHGKYTVDHVPIGKVRVRAKSGRGPHALPYFLELGATSPESECGCVCR